MKTSDNVELFHYLDTTYFDTLPHLTVSHPKILVVYSGGNAVGKSSLSKVLQEELQAVVLENDAIRAKILDRRPELVDDRKKLGNLAWQYTQYLYPSLASRTVNGLVVRDAVIDWSFEKVLPIFEQAGYQIFIVRFELSDEMRRRMIRTRGGKLWISTEMLEGQFGLHEMHSRRFLSHYKPDVILTDDTIFDYQSVVDALRKMIEGII